MNKVRNCLFLTFMMLFSSCSNKEIIQTKIEYDTSTIEYSNQTSLKATNAINYLLNCLFGKLETRENLLSISQNVEKILCENNINEDDYIEYFDYLLANTDLIVANYNKEDNNAISSFFEKTLETFGIENLSNSLYKIISYYYDYLILDYEDSIKENPKLENMYLSSIKEAKEDKEIFLSINEDSFNNLFNGLVMSYLFFNNHLEKDNDLSNDELLLFIKTINMDINLNENQWKIIFKNCQNFSFNLGQFFKNIILNEDYGKIGNSINDLFNLVNSYIQKLDGDDIDIIKTKDYEKILNNFINSLDSEEKELLKDMFNLSLDSSYLDCLDENIDVNLIKNATYHTVDDLFSCNEGSYLDTLYGVIKEVFYDRT